METKKIGFVASEIALVKANADKFVAYREGNEVSDEVAVLFDAIVSGARVSMFMDTEYYDMELDAEYWTEVAESKGFAVVELDGKLCGLLIESGAVAAESENAVGDDLDERFSALLAEVEANPAKYAAEAVRVFGIAETLTDMECNTLPLCEVVADYLSALSETNPAAFDRALERLESL